MTHPSGSSDIDSPHGAEPRDTSAMGKPSALANLSWQILLTMGLATIALGVVIFAWPKETLQVVGVLFGIYLLVTGVFQLAAAFGTHVPGHLRALHFITGALSVLLGLICFRGTLQSVLLLALWIGFSWLLRGIMMTATASSAPAMPARGWMLFFGIMSMLAGVVLIVSPFTSIAALTLAVGVMALVLGVVEVFHAIKMRIEVGRLAPGTAAKRRRRPLFHSEPHPQH
ncbi:HdeD family acid-resistance protein [Streptomyces pratens]|uniref:HdeD family acid-resistance protein n=2 Tax=Streptomyces TaxID=1883 RepID=A0ABW1M3C6_9ACTN|nr:HdeD family acid-resistance protein [Streptomyces hirsutus]WSD07180.1 HdeD family acid-resistance protein [Streptomyces hirsutus]WTD19402.1 HdeD family acid-resistance protein [Streptomyces hirsutus]